MKLLIVDDNHYVVTGISNQIDWAALGIEKVLGAYSARQARALLAEETVDFLLVDVEMPQENGFDLIRWVRERQPGIRIVILTSFAEYAYAEQAIYYHVFSYLLKPVSDEKLLSVFRDLVADERRRRENVQFAEVGKRSLVPESAQAPDKDRQLIDTVTAYIQENLSHVTRSELSAKFFVSPDYLSRLFRKETGMPLIEYIQRERMLRAKALLSQNNGLSIGQIAEAAGYANFAHFSRQFRKQTGMSPSEYRKRVPIQSTTE